MRGTGVSLLSRRQASPWTAKLLDIGPQGRSTTAYPFSRPNPKCHSVLAAFRSSFDKRATSIVPKGLSFRGTVERESVEAGHRYDYQTPCPEGRHVAPFSNSELQNVYYVQGTFILT